MHTPWYLEPEAKRLLICAGVEGVPAVTCSKAYAITVDHFTVYSGYLFKRINALHSQLFTDDLTREDRISRRAGVFAEDAIAFALGERVSERFVECPDDFTAILDAIEAARKAAA